MKGSSGRSPLPAFSAIALVTRLKVARDIGAEAGTARAVGGAVGANPIAMVVPCHRVVGSDGSLTGYAGGLERKVALLRLEGVLI